MTTAPAFWRRSEVTAAPTNHRSPAGDQQHAPSCHPAASESSLYWEFRRSDSGECSESWDCSSVRPSRTGSQATMVEGTVLNIVNWGCNVIAPVIAVACLGIAGWHFKSGRGYMGWGLSGVALMVISGLGRMAEGFITQAQGIP